MEVFHRYYYRMYPNIPLLLCINRSRYVQLKHLKVINTINTIHFTFHRFYKTYRHWSIFKKIIKDTSSVISLSNIYEGESWDIYYFEILFLGKMIPALGPFLQLYGITCSIILVGSKGNSMLLFLSRYFNNGKIVTA